ncbi:MAG: DUF1015 family protein [Hyphomicrobiaceae bacterium]|nr:DUF1015 family protein [Hyphomicrobiaceae bacterium]
MSLISPFRGLRPATNHADEILAPPYDVLSSAEAREKARGKPHSFLHISKPEIDLPEDLSPYDPQVYAMAAQNMQKLVDKKLLLQEDIPVYYAYRLTWGKVQMTGLVAAASVAEYDKNRIRKHEYTRPVKEDDRVRQIEAVNAQTGPVMLAYPKAPRIDEIIAVATSGEADMDVTGEDGVRHQLWVIYDDDMIGELSAGFEDMPAIYIADGHHRSAAASRISASLGGEADAIHHRFLSVIFPHHEMKILDYNRLVKDLNGLSREQLLTAIEKNFTLTKSDKPVKPATIRHFGMYVDGQWYELEINKELVPEDPVERLDISLLSAYIIEPLLGIKDPRKDDRIDFVGGIRGVRELSKRVDGEGWEIAFSLFPTSMDDLMAVAEQGQVMPPKSTWFEPKLADGVVSLVFGRI